jgi:putative ABC transport system permease protein
MFKNYLKVALRNLMRHKGYSAINIAGLAIGMACCIAISLLVYRDLSFDSFHDKGDRIYRLNTEMNLPGKASQNTALSMSPSGPAMIDEFPEVIGYTRFWQGGNEVKFNAQYKDRKITITTSLYSDPSIFDVFSFQLIAGDPATALEEPYSAVLTQESAQKIFGDEDPLGKVIQQNGKDDFKITGVLKKIPAASHIHFDMLMSICTSEEATRNAWGNTWSITYLLLEEGADVKALEGKFGNFLQKYMAKFSEYFVMYLQPLKKIHLHSSNIEYDLLNQKKTDVTYVYIFSAIALLILLIACINFMNLSTARSANRAKEVGIRKVVGAGRAQLIGQFLCESVFLAFCSVVLAVALLELLQPSLNYLFENAFDFNYFNSWLLPLALVGIVLLVGVLAGSYPAFFLSAFKPVVVLKGTVSSGGRGSALRKVLVVGQFAISIILIICTIFVVRQLSYMQNKNLGFNREQVISVPLRSGSLQKIVEPLKNQWLQNPSVTGVTASRFRLGEVMAIEGIFFKGHNPDELATSAMMAVDYDYLSFYGLEIVAGRDFSREFTTDYLPGNSGAYIINEALQKKLGWDSALGKKFGTNPENLGTVIGVVKDFHFNSLHHKIEPLFFSIRPGRIGNLSVRIKPEDMDATLGSLRKTWAEHSPNQPFEYSFLDEDFARLYKNEKLVARIFGAFSLLAVFVSCLGLFGLISYSAEQRTKEIGIRKVLGASISNIVLLLSREFLMLLGIALVFACPVAWYFMDRWLQNFAYRIELGPETFVLGGAIALVITVLTVSYQAIKAAYANPVEALRYE